jgi:8-oxo-dGTP pyrophosphatase MutT (NUDIX family)
MAKDAETWTPPDLAQMTESGYHITRRKVGFWVVLQATPPDGGGMLHAAHVIEATAVSELLAAYEQAEAEAATARTTAAQGILPAQTWALVQASVPIVCVDLALLRRGADGSIKEIGLIWRQVPETGERWTLVGGRLRRGESIADGITRQVRETLGPAARPILSVNPPLPAAIGEYAPGLHEGRPFDLRQHAIGLTYGLTVVGPPVPSGEAIKIAWFAPAALPAKDLFGFGQWAVLADLLESLGEVDAATRLRGS